MWCSNKNRLRAFFSYRFDLGKEKFFFEKIMIRTRKSRESILRENYVSTFQKKSTDSLFLYHVENFKVNSLIYKVKFK